MKRMVEIAIASSVILCISVSSSLAGIWQSSDLLNNNWSEWSYDSNWNSYKSRVNGSNLQVGLYSSGSYVFNMNVDIKGTATKSVNVITGKRYKYQVRGKRKSYITQLPISSEWWIDVAGENRSSASSSSNYRKRNITFIARQNSATLKTISHFEAAPVGVCYCCYSDFDYATLKQVIYNPQLDIQENDLTVDFANLSSKTVNLNLLDLSFADTPDNWWIDWGDGTIDYNPTLNSIASHEYNLTEGYGQTWTATLYGENVAGSMSDTIEISAVPEPTTIFLIGLGGLILRKRKS